MLLPLLVGLVEDGPHPLLRLVGGEGVWKCRVRSSEHLSRAEPILELRIGLLLRCVPWAPFSKGASAEGRRWH